MKQKISRRGLIGGAIALSGSCVLGSVTLAEGVAIASDTRPRKEFITGFVHDHFLGHRSPNCRWLVSDNGSDSTALWRPFDSGVRPADFEHGAWIMAMRQKGANDDKNHKELRILHAFAPDSWEAESARQMAQEAARIFSKWVTVRVVSRRRRCGLVLVLGQFQDKHGITRLHYLRPVGVLHNAKGGDAVKIKIGRTWEGWQVFDSVMIPGKSLDDLDWRLGRNL